MFATVPRMRSYGSSQRQRQEEEKPEPGTDSTYGVRSLGSVDSDWGRDSEARVIEDEMEDTPEGVREEQAQEVDLPLITGTGSGSAEEWTPTSDQTTLPQTPSPTIPSLSHYLHERERDNLSEPSSPASFASMPSYMSSLSRTSSLAEAHHPIGIGMGGSEELVLPIINVQSQSVPRWKSRPQAGKGLKVVILGDEARVEGFVAELKEVKEIVDVRLDGGIREYAIIGGDDVVVTLSIGASAEDIETRIENAYSSLDSVLHPDPSPEARRRLEDLAVDYAGKSDWIHLLFVLEAEDSSVEALAQMVPTLSATSTSSPLFQLPAAQAPSPANSPLHVPDPTPRPGTEADASSYFTSHFGSRTSSTAVEQFIQALDNIAQIRQASIDKFFTWRPTHSRSPADLASSHTSHESSSAFEAAPMPTVARAQGGGEWEANLSRRLAKRRQSEDQHQHQHQHQGGGGGSTPARRGGKRRTSSGKSSKKKAEACGPLFPFSIPSDPFGGGGGDKRAIFSEVLVGLRKRWKWGALAAAAVALVIGWNWVKAA